MLRSVAIAFFLIVSATASQDPSPTPPENGNEPQEESTTEEDEGSETQEQPQATIPPENQSNSVSINIQTDEEGREEEDGSSGDWLLIVFTGALAVVGILQWLNMRRQTHIAADQTKILDEGLMLTRESAEAATSSAATARESLHLTERAWLAPDEMKLILNVGQPIEVRYFLVNTGRTVATLIGSKGQIRIAEELPDTESPLHSESLRLHSSQVAVGRHTNFHYGPEEPLIVTEQLVEALRSGPQALNFFAHIEYRDVFGRSHKMGFGVQWDPKADSFAMIDSSTYNYAD